MDTRVVLLHNLQKRFEYNEKQDLYAIKGAITKEEYAAFEDAIKALREDCLYSENDT